jgi:hypothetical protein
MKIRITSKGIFGLAASDENPTGEYPIGHEIDLGKNEPPAGWAGRYEEVGGKGHKDAEMVVNPADDSAERGTESKDQADQPRRARPAGN